MNTLDECEKIIGYKFKDRSRLETALSHSSYANEHHIESNERLEFLGDSVLSIIVSEKLFNLFQNDDEGDLSKIRASLVCEKGLFDISKKINLSDYIRLGKGEELSGGRNRASVVSDAFEALLAAIFLDSDFDTAKKWLLGIMSDRIKKSDKKPSTDYKTMIQEIIQKSGKKSIAYKLIEEGGPDHDKHFTVAILIDGKSVAMGTGKRKKDAEQMAARNAMKKL